MLFAVFIFFDFSEKLPSSSTGVCLQYVHPVKHTVPSMHECITTYASSSSNSEANAHITQTYLPLHMRFLHVAGAKSESCTSRNAPYRR